MFACKSLKFTLMSFALKSISITFVQPFCAAKWIAAFLWLLPLLTSAPPRSKSSTMPSLPFCAAIRRSVFPMCNYRQNIAPCLLCYIFIERKVQMSIIILRTMNVFLIYICTLLNKLLSFFYFTIPDERQ